MEKINWFQSVVGLILFIGIFGPFLCFVIKECIEILKGGYRDN